jgi:hypothetical protein
VGMVMGAAIPPQPVSSPPSMLHGAYQAALQVDNHELELNFSGVGPPQRRGVSPARMYKLIG